MCTVYALAVCVQRGHERGHKTYLASENLALPRALTMQTWRWRAVQQVFVNDC